MDYKVSVVIPVYGVSDYIERCAESLFRQTLNDIQFIFVDDASPDDSISKLKLTLERFPHRQAHTLILHHPQHRSLPEARATGLAAAEAPYVAHCDSDDFVAPDMYEKLYDTAIREGADMVICDYYLHYHDGKHRIVRNVHSADDNVLKDFLYDRLRRSVWCRLTRTDIYRKACFPSDNYLEDCVQVAQLLAHCDHIALLPLPLYHQVLNPDSITGDKRLDVIEEQVWQCKANYAKMHDFIMGRGLAEEEDFIVLKDYIRRRFWPLLAHSQGRKSYLNTFPEINLRLFMSPYVGKTFKLAHLCILLGIFPLFERLVASNA